MLFWFFLRATNDLSKQANTLCYNVRDVNSGTSFLIYLPYVLLLPYTEYSVASSLNRCFFCSTLSSLLSFHQPIYSPLLSSFAQDVCCLFCHCSDIWNWMCVTNIFRRDLLVLFYCRSVVGEMVVANSIVTMQPPYRKKRFHRYSWCHCILLVFFFVMFRTMHILSSHIPWTKHFHWKFTLLWFFLLALSLFVAYRLVFWRNVFLFIIFKQLLLLHRIFVSNHSV